MGPTRRLNDEEIAARKKREVLEKDATEIALEKALFGDSAGFLDSLNQTAQAEERQLARIPGSDDDGNSASEDEGMQDVADEDLFFLDGGTTDLPDDVMQDLQVEEHGAEEGRHRRKVLWHDSDDERLTVSLASNTRLRKLRDTEDDDVVSGLEYIRRLRRQYERLHPTPDWVKYARKKRKLNKDNDEDSSGSDSDVSIDAPSVKPLADLLRTAAPLTRTAASTTSISKKSPTSSLKLRPEVIDIQRLKDIASSGPSSIDALQFHPTYPLLLTSGPSSTITLYHISPTSQNPNPILTSLHVKKQPITTALFSQPHDATNPTTNIYFSSRRRYFHTWSLSTSQITKLARPTYQSTPSATSLTTTNKKKKPHDIPTCEHLILSPDSSHLAIIANTGSTGGTLHILSTTTHQPTHTVRIDSLNGIAAASFYADSTGASIVGKNGEVTEFSLLESRVTARWTDAGAVGTTTLALGGVLRDPKSVSGGVENMGTDRYVAIGSISGIVNVYDRVEIMRYFARQQALITTTTTTTYRPTPIRSLTNLTTPISHLVFSPDPAGQLLVMASRWKKNALRLVHMPGCTVYKNWPTDKTPLGRVSSVALSPDSRYLAVGNEAGKVRLWEIRD